MKQEYDLIVIGAGPGGYVSAIRAAQLGMSVAIIEKRSIGGTCLNRGCIPAKTLMHSARRYSQMKRGELFGVSADAPSFDLSVMYRRKDEVAAQLREGVEQLLKGNRVTVFTGTAQIVSPNAVTVTGEEGSASLMAKQILIATGAAPAPLPIEGIELPGVLTSEEILQSPGRAFSSLVIIGGGVIGVEFASVFSALGVDVTVIEAMDRILPLMDKELSQSLSMGLKKQGVKIFTGAKVTLLEKDDRGLLCHFEHKGKAISAPAQAVLVAVGRKASVQGLFGPGIEVAYDKGIVVNEHFESSIKGIYAVGDVISGGIQLAHMASAQGINAVMHMNRQYPEVNLTVVPSCVYTSPEIASVGITEAQGKERGIPVKIGKFIMTGNGKNIIESGERGFIKLLFSEETQALLGAQLMCPRATDLVSELSSAIANGLTAEQMASVIRPHPSFSEGITEAAQHALHGAIHTMPKK